jgi:hypothetical protein
LDEQTGRALRIERICVREADLEELAELAGEAEPQSR